MAEPIVIDIETQNTFRDVGVYDPLLLNVSLVGIFDYATKTYESFLEHELNKLWPRLERSSHIIGFNSLYFDIPILNKYYAGNLLEFSHIDILLHIKDVLTKAVRLEDVAHATLGRGKSGDGLMAIHLWREKKIDELRLYCLDDVKITKEVYEFGMQNGFVKYRTPLGTRQVKINFLPLGKQVKINFTLPL